MAKSATVCVGDSGFAVLEDGAAGENQRNECDGGAGYLMGRHVVPSVRLLLRNPASVSGSGFLDIQCCRSTAICARVK